MIVQGLAIDEENEDLLFEEEGDRKKRQKLEKAAQKAEAERVRAAKRQEREEKKARDEAKKKKKKEAKQTDPTRWSDTTEDVLLDALYDVIVTNMVKTSRKVETKHLPVILFLELFQLERRLRMNFNLTFQFSKPISAPRSQRQNG